ncbi:MAG: tRNA lysidine(34) synthetase TilS [Rhodovarius sp.]|nr:tRNA lysidine(34) synthetase TilS [Rhodovarius sp.]
MTPEAFAARLDGLGPPPRRVALGVSGGPDSLALALLAEAWAAARGVALVALIADHGLRPGSGAEAEGVARLLSARGMEVRLLRLAIPPGAALQERAREARHAALLAACAEAGAPWLLLGHQRADQAETLLMRAETGSGPLGLAGMPFLRAAPQALLIRPLLDVAPAVLAALCAAAGVIPLADPANRDPRFRRARLRSALGDPGGEGPRIAALTDAAAALGRRRAVTEAALAARLAACARIHPGGAVRIDRAALGRDRLAVLLLGRLIRAVGGSPHAPATEATARLLEAGQGTLGGAWWRPDGWLLREPTACAPPVPAEAGAVWDGRFVLGSGWAGCLVGAAGPGLPRPRGIPAALAAGLPALWRGGRRLAVPHLGLGPPVPDLLWQPAGGPIAPGFVPLPRTGHSPDADPPYVRGDTGTPPEKDVQP